MRGLWRRSAALVVVLAFVALAPGLAAAQTPVAAGAQTWHIQVDNVSPPGHNWSFNAFYPDHVQAHPGDTIVFTLANNQQAFHTAHVLPLGMTPLEFYQGFAAGFQQPYLNKPGTWQRTFFGGFEAATPCGRAGQTSCPISHVQNAVEFGISSGVLVNPPPSGGKGNTSFAVTLDPQLSPGVFYFMSDVDGPTMSGRIDVVPADQPVQSAADLQADAQRQYQADLTWFASQDRISNPPESSNPDGTKTWQASAGMGSPDGRLAINQFFPSAMVVRAGDTVTWSDHGPAQVPHTVSGFAPSLAALPTNLSPFQAGCQPATGPLVTPPPGSFPPDLWNTCVNAEVALLTKNSQPSAPSGTPYTSGERTSGILLNQAYLDSPIGYGLPYSSTYSVTFPKPGIYYYACAIHPNMTGVVVVIPPPRPA